MEKRGGRYSISINGREIKPMRGDDFKIIGRMTVGHVRTLRGAVGQKAHIGGRPVDDRTPVADGDLIDFR